MGESRNMEKCLGRKHDCRERDVWGRWQWVTGVGRRGEIAHMKQAATRVAAATHKSRGCLSL